MYTSNTIIIQTCMLIFSHTGTSFLFRLLSLFGRESAGALVVLEETVEERRKTVESQL